MKIEYFEKAGTLRSEINYLKDLLDRTSNGSPSSGMKIELKTGYSDMGLDFTCSMEPRKDLAVELWHMIRKHIQSKIDELEKEFEEL